MSIIFFSAPFSPSLLIFPSCVCYIFYNCLTVFGYYVPFFLFAFQFWEVSIGISFSSLVPCLSMDSLLMSSSKAFFISVISDFYLQHFFLVLSQDFHLSAYIAHLFLCAVYFRALSIVIVIVLNSHSENFSTLSYMFLVCALTLQIFFLPFAVP